ncbi:MAG TPA: hypothetical protein VEL28_00970 [Candidatus Binatia bacterium]|nr:hypothetical protein [Candidatus Binatia bacterium]
MKRLARRLMAAFVALALAAPAPAMASGSCSMSSPTIRKASCHCCKTPAGAARCAKPAGAALRCSCATDDGTQARQTSAGKDSSVSGKLSQPALAPSLLPAALHAPVFDAARALPLEPPDAYASTLRTRLCSWII